MPCGRIAARFGAVRPDDPRDHPPARIVAACVEDLQDEEGRLANRLREQLYRVDAAWLTLCPAADEPWLWTVLARHAASRRVAAAAAAACHRRRCGRTAFDE